jgi:asparagine N-glycosylation enzyme membrane subunit Stt3
MALKGAAATRRIGAGLVRYLVAGFVLELLLGLAGALQSGLSVGAAVLQAIFVVIWVGWILILAGLAVAAVFLLLLYDIVPRYRRPSRWIAVGLSAAIWTVVATALLAFAVVSNSQSRDQPMTLGSALSGLVGSAIVGALFGAVEALAIKP